MNAKVDGTVDNGDNDGTNAADDTWGNAAGNTSNSADNVPADDGKPVDGSKNHPSTFPDKRPPRR